MSKYEECIGCGAMYPRAQVIQSKDAGNWDWCPSCGDEWASDTVEFGTPDD